MSKTWPAKKVYHLVVSRSTVLQLLAGHTALIRRRISPQPEDEDSPWPTDTSHTLIGDLLEDARGGWCPQGEPGQQFWLREAYSYSDKTKTAVVFRADLPADSPPPVFWLKPYLLPREFARLGAEVVRVYAQSEVDADNQVVWFWVREVKYVVVEALASE